MSEGDAPAAYLQHCQELATALGHGTAARAGYEQTTLRRQQAHRRRIQRLIPAQSKTGWISV